MGLFSKKDSIDTLESEKDRLEIESEVMTKKAEVAEKEAIIAQLKKQYGTNWKSILGIDKIDLQTLRTFLKQAKKGLEKAGGPRGNPLLNPMSKSVVGAPGSPVSVLPPRGIRRA